MKIMMKNKSGLPEFEKSFDFSFESSSKTETFNSDPKNGFLWREEKANPNDLIGSLKKIFETGFTPGNEQLSPEMYSYNYLIESSHHINSLALCEENSDNPTFTTDDNAEKISEEPGYAIISKVDPQCIIGAMPSALVAFTLGLPKQSFITNPTYNKIFICEKIKAAIGGEFLLIASECFFTRDISRNDVDRRCLQTSKSSIHQTNLGASSSQNSQCVVFFSNNAADNPSSKETTQSPRP